MHPLILENLLKFNRFGFGVWEKGCEGGDVDLRMKMTNDTNDRLQFRD